MSKNVIEELINMFNEITADMNEHNKEDLSLKVFIDEFDEFINDVKHMSVSKLDSIDKSLLGNSLSVIIMHDKDDYKDCNKDKLKNFLCNILTFKKLINYGLEDKVKELNDLLLPESETKFEDMTKEQLIELLKKKL